MLEGWEQDFYCHIFSGANAKEGDWCHYQVVPVMKEQC